MTQMNVKMKQTQNHGHREQTCAAKGDRMGCELGVSRCKLVYIGWINKVLLYRKLYLIS